MSLTNEDRALITEKSPGDETTEGWEYALLHRTVEQIVARHVAEARAAALTEAADAVLNLRALAGPEGVEWMRGAADMRAEASRVVRNLAATPPPP